jgi:antitoxin VapB
MNEKERRLAQFCRDNGYDGVLLRRRSNIAWLTDGADVHCETCTSTGVASVLWTPRKRVVLTTNIERARLVAEEFNDDWQIQEHPWWEGNGASPEGRFATDYPEDIIAPLRFSLTPLEIKRVRELGADSGEIVCNVMHDVQPGMTEHEVAAALLGQFRRREIHCPVLLIAADDRIAQFRHPIPTSRKIEKAVEVVVCPQRHGLYCCITRIVHFGPVPEALRRKHEAVCQVDAAMLAATRAGVCWGDIFETGVKVYEQTGFADEWKNHHQGGPLGYEPRDFLVTPGDERIVQENQLVGWNPSITGTKSEDTMLSTGEVITVMPDWPVCGSRPDILCRRNRAAVSV